MNHPGSSRFPLQEDNVGLLPAAAEGLIELHKALVFVIARLRQTQFSTEQGPLAIEDVEISRRAASITHQRNADRLLKVLHGLLLPLAGAMVFLIANQGVRNIAERPLDRLLIADQGLPIL